jgi:ParB-like chromosome segregation protein Spo0J
MAFASTKTSTLEVSFSLMNIHELKEHEETDPKHLERLLKEIKSDGILKRPIAVDKNTGVVLDGAHRLKVLKIMGYSLIPVIIIDYKSPSIIVKSWRKGEKITKEMVIEAGLSKNKLPPKSSKHMVEINGKIKHISFLEKRVDFPLEKLR